MTDIRCLGIVNRGEAAMRCIRAVKALRASERSSLRAVALYTDVDRDAPFVRHADAAIRLPVSTGEVRAYLDHDLVIAALARAGADAVWPGWGFVAEDPGFADRVVAEGMVFLGPSGAAMRALGDKIAAKQLAERAGVPVTPWSGGAVDEAKLARAGKRVGYPLVVKAAAGGGGRGIRRVDDATALAAAFRSAASEARTAFGDDRLFLERAVDGARHIEVQIAADAHGHTLALGARDCSVQRRHQKIIEEAPPPALDAALQSELFAAAIGLAREVGYVGLGTVEFLVRGEQAYFLEMNPRLQVEHGITEAITDIDLVQLQIRIARGERLIGLEPRERGVAIEARVCAEDGDAGFVPTPGRIARFDPALGPGIRVDTGVVAGSVVPAAFDSLIAKVIATGATREEARSRLVCALADLDLVIEGGASNTGYLISLLNSEELRAGGVDTGWVERRRRDEQSSGDASDALVGAAILAYQRRRRDARANFFADATSVSATRVPPSLGQEVDLSFAGAAYRLHVFALGAWRYRVHLDGRAASVTLRECDDHLARLEFDDRTRRVVYDATAAGLRLELDGQPYRFGWETTGHVRAATPAVVVGLQVAAGERVSAGQLLGFLEAMKVEIGFSAPCAGVVSEIRVGKGQLVAAGDVLMVIEPEAEHATATSAGRLMLDSRADPLGALLEAPEGAAQDLSALDTVPAARQEAAVVALRDEIRSVVVGYDADPVRAERLAALLASCDAAELSTDLRDRLALLAHEIVVFADLEQLFLTAPRAAARGRVDPSNAARLRAFVRRMRAAGAGVAPEFLELLRSALGHYGIGSLDHCDALERALLRLFATQNAPQVRRQLVRAVLRCLTGLTRAGAPPAGPTVADALARIGAMRAVVTDALSDAAIEAHALMFEGPALEHRAERATQRVEPWLAAADDDDTTPTPHDVLLDLAATPRPVFDRVGPWMFEGKPRRAGIALSAYLLRLYAPEEPVAVTAVRAGGVSMRALELADRRMIIGAACTAVDAAGTVERACVAIDESHARVHAIEIVVPFDEGDLERVIAAVTGVLETTPLPAGRCTVSFVRTGGGDLHRTLLQGKDGITEDASYHALHPETAARVGMARLANFTLERMPGADDIYCFWGRSRAVPEDERLFVLADVRGRTSGDPADAALDIVAFERLFHQATSAVRALRSVRDPRRRMHWNRIAITVGPAVTLERAAMERMSHRLAPATRHLGLEKVLVRLRLRDPQSQTTSTPVELVVSDLTGSHLDFAIREPRSAALEPVSDYERKLAEARRRRLVYPYEIVRMLITRNGDTTGSFQEYDLDPATNRALPVERPYGLNQAGVVFGILRTPTEKVSECMERVLVMSDPTRDLGALAAPESDRVVAALDLAEERGLPVEWIPISSGARIAMDSGTENLDATARTARRIITFTARGGVIHVIVYGVNVGAQSYWNALATMHANARGALVMTPDASMVLTGRAALEASGSVTAEDEVALGGFERSMGVNGEAQYYADDLAAALRTLEEHYRYSYVVPGESGPRWFRTADPIMRDITKFAYPPEHGHGFATLGELFDDTTNPGRKRPFAMRAVMQALTDQDGGHLERWHAWVGAETAIVWDAHLGGIPITLIGIESQNVSRDGYRPLDGPAAWSGGTLFPLSSKKVARALNAACGNRPAVILANLAGFDGSPESLRKLQLEYGAEIARAVVNFDRPLLFLVISRYHGGAYVVFSRSLNPNLHAMALTGSYASVIGGSAASTVIFTREVRARAAAHPLVRRARESWRTEPSPATRDAWEQALADATATARAEVAAEFDAVHTVERAREVGSLADIIEPHLMRFALIRVLRASCRDPHPIVEKTARGKKPARPPRPALEGST